MELVALASRVAEGADEEERWVGYKARTDLLEVGPTWMAAD